MSQISIGTSIGYAEFYSGKNAELVRLGVNSTSDSCLARLNFEGAKRLQGFEMANKGNGNVVVTLKKRGKEYSILAEALAAIRVGATDRYNGPFANRRIKEKTIIIVDATVGTPQRVEDMKGDGDLYQTDGPVGPTYPVKVGKVDYLNGRIDFTFARPVTAPTTADYVHTDWTAFGTSITFNMAGGGSFKRLDLMPETIAGMSDNFIDGIKGETEIGWFGKLSAAGQQRTQLGLNVFYFGDDSKIKLPILKGEVDDVPVIGKGLVRR